MTDLDLSALDAFDQAEFKPTRDRRNSYTGPIPAQIAKFVKAGIASGRIGFLPLSEEQQAEYAPIITAAAKVDGYRARVWSKFGPKDESGEKGPRLGTNVSFSAPKPGDDAADENDENEQDSAE